MHPFPEALDQLAARVDALEKRVSHLENGAELVVPALKSSPSQKLAAPLLAPPVSSSDPGTGVLTTIGKALLGIAGAYVLRALSGSGTLPRGVIAVIAAVYAAAWLVAASRAVTRRRFSGILFAATSVLILAPMLWEMCLSFRAMPAWMAAGILAGYVTLATVLANSSARSAVFSVAYGGAALTALALSIATHEMAVFTVILVAMLAVCEVMQARGRAIAIRPMIALAADVSVWTLLYIYRLPAAGRTDYPALYPGAILFFAILLLAMIAGAIAIRCGWRLQTLSVFDVVQTMIAFALVFTGVWWFVPASAPVVLGPACIVLAAICYTSAYRVFRALPAQRNFRVFNVWSACLLPGGLFLALPASTASALLAIAGLVAVLFADRLRSTTMELQGIIFLAMAASASGLLVYVFRVLAAGIPSAPSWGMLLVSACAIASYAAADEAPAETWQKQFVHFVPALLAFWMLAGLLAHGITGAGSYLLVSDASQIALERTFALCFLALAFAFGGSRLKRPQMIRLAYVGTAAVAIKVLAEDMPRGRLEFIAAAMCLVALTLIAVPRLARRPRMT